MWHPCRAFGFIYYEAWLDPTTHLPVAWISRETEAHDYNVFFCDGKNKAVGNCGSQHGARWLAADFVARYVA